MRRLHNSLPDNTRSVNVHECNEHNLLLNTRFVGLVGS